jgi:alkylation response protein AidB-like acyl-CoA dehydrogenase
VTALSDHATPSAATDGLAQLKEEVAAYVQDAEQRWVPRIERQRSVPLELWDELRDRGYLRLTAPVEHGGRGLALADYLELLELLSKSHASLRMIVHVCNGIWRPIAASASAQQRERFLTPLVAGEIKVAFALTEPGAGTGADLRCEAVRDGDSYYLSGQKHLITFGTIADYLLVIARLQGTTGADGTLALMVSPNGEGVRASAMAESMGLRGTDHAQIVFDGAPVPVANRLGEEGDGLAVAIGGFLAPSRISLAMTCVGLAQRALELAVDYAKRRETFGQPLARRQAISFPLAEMATDVQAARLLVLHAARAWERDHEAGVTEASMAKLFAAEMLQRVTDGALRVHGGLGYFAPSPIERVYRDARAQLFEEGTAEVQKMTIARELLRG